MYELCAAHDIPYRVTQKWILAQNPQQHEQLCRTHEFARSIGVPTSFVPLSEAKIREPDVVAREAILESPTTGIVDSHALMSYLEADIQANGGDLAFHTAVSFVEPLNSGASGYRINTRSAATAEPLSITTETLVNSAGLAAIQLSNQILPLLVTLLLSMRKVRTILTLHLLHGQRFSYIRRPQLVLPVWELILPWILLAPSASALMWNGLTIPMTFQLTNRGYRLHYMKLKLTFPESKKTGS